LMGVLILFLLLDAKISERTINPLYTVLISVVSYILLFALSYMDLLYIRFVGCILLCIIMVGKFKNYFISTVIQFKKLKVFFFV